MLGPMNHKGTVPHCSGACHVELPQCPSAPGDHASLDHTGDCTKHSRETSCRLCRIGCSSSDLQVFSAGKVAAATRKEAEMRLQRALRKQGRHQPYAVLCCKCITDVYRSHRQGGGSQAQGGGEGGGRSLGGAAAAAARAAQAGPGAAPGLTLCRATLPGHGSDLVCTGMSSLANCASRLPGVSAAHASACLFSGFLLSMAKRQAGQEMSRPHMQILFTRKATSLGHHTHAVMRRRSWKSRRGW